MRVTCAVRGVIRAGTQRRWGFSRGVDGKYKYKEWLCPALHSTSGRGGVDRPRHKDLGVMWNRNQGEMSRVTRACVLSGVSWQSGGERQRRFCGSLKEAPAPVLCSSGIWMLARRKLHKSPFRELAEKMALPVGRSRTPEHKICRRAWGWIWAPTVPWQDALGWCSACTVIHGGPVRNSGLESRSQKKRFMLIPGTTPIHHPHPHPVPEFCRLQTCLLSQ